MVAVVRWMMMVGTVRGKFKRFRAGGPSHVSRNGAQEYL